MWYAYTGAIAAACVVGLVWLVVAYHRSANPSPMIVALIALPLFSGLILLGVPSLIAFADSTTGVSAAVAQVHWFSVLLHRALHVAFGVTLCGLAWMFRVLWGT